MNMTFRPAMPAQSIQPYPASKTFAEAAASYMEHGGRVVADRHNLYLFENDL